jgi:hypothetical protein
MAVVMDTAVALDQFHFESMAPCWPCLLKEVLLATVTPTPKREMVETRVIAVPRTLRPKAHTLVDPQDLVIRVPMVHLVAALVMLKKKTVALQEDQATVEVLGEILVLPDTLEVAQEVEAILGEAVGLEAAVALG